MSRAVSVLLDDGLDRPLDYTYDGSVEIGMRAHVPLRGRTVKGTIIALKDQPEVKNALPILGILGDEAHLPPELFKLAQWMSGYYVTPLRRVIRMMLPNLLRGKAKPMVQKFVKRAVTQEKLMDAAAQMRRVSRARAQILDVLLKANKGILLSELLEKAQTSASPVKTLEKEGLIKIEDLAIDRTPLQNAEFFPTKHKTLNDQQQNVLLDVCSSIDKGIFLPHLIHGITGSGKTEVYMQAIDHALKLGKGVIMLVPEIALTAQTIERLTARIQSKIAVLHHRLSDGERFDTWQAIRRGDIKCVLGARSALFAPIQNLGLIIIDEEHENSYKQSEEMPCYHARDVALVRAKFEQATAILGSATPALESYLNAASGKYRLHTLTTRATKANLPAVKIVDMKSEYQKNDGYTLFSNALLRGIEERYARGEQVLLFLNRRGYHPMRKCGACAKTIKCPHCDVSLTFHKTIDTLYCHCCSYQLRPPPRICPYCKAADNLQYKGAGTEQIERALHAILPDVRTLRMDADTTRHKGSHERLFKQFRAGKADVLIGTQMIAKGLHFPAVTLVGVLGTDTSLNIPDFRSSEHVFQLIAQVSGRSGRGALPGTVIIQTHLPDHPVIIHASKEDYPTFYNEELAIRKLFDYPPYVRLARLIFTGESETITYNTANTIRATLAEHLPPSILLLPVTPCGCARIKDRYRFHFLIKGKSLTPLNKALKSIQHSTNKTTLLIDIDPTSIYY